MSIPLSILSSLSALVSLLYLLPLIIASSSREGPTIYSNARDFYHGLGTVRQQELLHTVDLQDPHQVKELLRLLSDKTYNISGAYNNACGKMIKMARVREIVKVVEGDKNLEMHLLGPTCLSGTIIRARKKHNIWPPSGFPLLVNGLNLRSLTMAGIKEILEEALKNPEWWNSSKWIEQFDWDHMDDFRFWKLIPFKEFSKNPSSYLKRALFGTIGKPNELMMKFIRVLFFMDSNEQALNGRELACRVNAFLENFAQYQRQWHIEIVTFFTRLCTDGTSGDVLFQALLESKLLEWNAWQETINSGLLTYNVAINDLFGLFTVAIKFGMGKEKIMQLLDLFLDGLNDLSDASPIMLGGLFDMRYTDSCWYSFFEKHVNRLSNDPRFISVLSLPQNAFFTSLQNVQYILKKSIPPLIEKFSWREANTHTHLDPYGEILYQRWIQDVKNWPGLIVADEQASHTFSVAFKASSTEPGMWDPRVDAKYNWKLIFSSIAFKVYHGIPNKIVLSTCFFRALEHYQRDVLNWDGLKDNAGNWCILPKSQSQKDQYLSALRAAKEAFGLYGRLFSWNHAKVLHALIQRGLADTCVDVDGSTDMILLKEPTLYSHPREFYHDLNWRRQWELLHSSNLSDPHEVVALIRLLSDKTFNIQWIYNESCTFISVERAQKIVELIKGRRDFEEMLLGLSCLTNTIVKVRRENSMWPPNSGITALPIGLSFANVDIEDAKKVLLNALDQPRSWYGTRWVYNINWDRMNDQSFWRIIPLFEYFPSINDAIHLYQKRVLQATNNPSGMQSIEELFMNVIRALYFRSSPLESFEMRAFICGSNGFLKRFRFNYNSWCARALGVLERLCSCGFNWSVLPGTLIEWGMFEFNEWQAAVLEGVMSQARATNDILELFTVALSKSRDSEQIRFLTPLDAFLTLTDLSEASPLGVCALLSVKFYHTEWVVLIQKHTAKIISYAHLIPALITHQRVLFDDQNIVMARSKQLSHPLLHGFVLRELNAANSLTPYMEALYTEWSYERERWPGLMVAHELASRKIRKVFEPSQAEPGTWNPKVDVSYSRPCWILAFSSIIFQVEYAIPGTPRLSLCFLKALIYVHGKRREARPIDWDELKGEADNCDFPNGPQERNRYLFAIHEADYQIFRMSMTCHWMTAKQLQLVLSGNLEDDCACPKNDLTQYGGSFSFAFGQSSLSPRPHRAWLERSRRTLVRHLSFVRGTKEGKNYQNLS